MKVFISGMLATEPDVHVAAPPQFVPPVEGQPVSEMMCFDASALRITSCDCQKLYVQAAADEPGKEWEDKWGLMDVNRNLKPGVVIPSCGGKTVS